jgi:hypothetical protein
VDEWGNINSVIKGEVKSIIWVVNYSLPIVFKKLFGLTIFLPVFFAKTFLASPAILPPFPQLAHVLLWLTII